MLARLRVRAAGVECVAGRSVTLRSSPPPELTIGAHISKSPGRSGLGRSEHCGRDERPGRARTAHRNGPGQRRGRSVARSATAAARRRGSWERGAPQVARGSWEPTKSCAQVPDGSREPWGEVRAGGGRVLGACGEVSARPKRVTSARALVTRVRDRHARRDRPARTSLQREQVRDQIVLLRARGLRRVAVRIADATRTESIARRRRAAVVHVRRAQADAHRRAGRHARDRIDPNWCSCEAHKSRRGITMPRARPRAARRTRRALSSRATSTRTKRRARARVVCARPRGRSACRSGSTPSRCAALGPRSACGPRVRGRSTARARRSRGTTNARTSPSFHVLGNGSRLALFGFDASVPFANSSFAVERTNGPPFSSSTGA